MVIEYLFAHIRAMTFSVLHKNYGANDQHFKHFGLHVNT